MRKLNQRKIRWIIREMEKRRGTFAGQTKLQNVTPRWVKELYRRYTETGEYPYPNKPGRKPSPISDEERRIVMEIRKQHPVCAVTLEKILVDNDTRFKLKFKRWCKQHDIDVIYTHPTILKLKERLRDA